MAAAGGSGASQTYVDDVFGIQLYNGNAATRTITTGIDLATEGGLVWIKRRNTAEDHCLFDTIRGANNKATFVGTTAPSTLANSLTAFGASDFSLGSATGVNTNAGLYAAWVFRKASKFFDLKSVSHTTGLATTVDLSLLGDVGMVMVRATSGAANWWVWHPALTAGNNLRNTTAAQTTTAAHLSVSGTTLTIAGGMATGTYIIYAWAHDIESDGMVQCGVYTGNGSATGPVIDLGWEPQFLIIKRRDTTANWYALDVARGMPVVGGTARIFPDATTAEDVSTALLSVSPDGFQLTSTNSQTNASGGAYVYMAIRRSNKPPTSGASVFVPTVYTGTNADNRLIDTTIAPDMVMLRNRNGSGAGYEGFVVGDRLRGQEWFKTELTAPVATVTADGLDQQLATSEWGTAFSSSNGVYVGNNTGATSATVNVNASTTANGHIALAFKRAAGFFEQVTYTGTAVARAINHRLGVMPEMVWIKRRDSTAMNFICWHKSLSSVNHQILLDTAAGEDGPFSSEISNITDSQLSLGAGTPNASGGKFIAYLFATMPGVSKVGGYTGNGSSQTINCGFSAGARFIMVKAIAGGSCYIFDSARGIGTGNDPYLATNSTAAEGTGSDAIDPDGSGFIVNSTLGLNVSGESYMYLAIA